MSYPSRVVGRDLVRYVASLTISQGQGSGEAFVVLPWEGRFLRGAFGVAGDAALSVARGNGKSTLTAAVADAVLRGPLGQPRAEAVVCASSFDQARVIFDHVLSFGPYREDRSRWRVQDSANRAAIECRETGARLRCIGSDPRRAHGLAPALVLADEPAQWPRTTGEAMLAALRTGLGKVPGSRLIALGTRADDDSHWFGRMLAGVGTDYAQCHAAREKDPKFHRRTWKRANPSLDFMPHLEARIRKEAAEAKQDPALMAAFCALRLNQGVADTEQQHLLDPGTWARVELDVLEPEGRYVLGLDLGGSAAMSSAAGYWPQCGRLEAVAVFSEQPALLERGMADGVGRLYVDMHARGELFTAGQYVADVRALLAECLRRWGPPAALTADRYREAELRQTLEAMSFPVVPLVLRGQGFVDGGQDVRAFRRAVGGGRVRPIISLLLRSAMSAARTTTDPAGNAKLAKQTQGGRRAYARDDAAAASILAVALGEKGGGASDEPIRAVLV